MAQHPDYSNAQHTLQLELNLKDEGLEKQELGVAGDVQVPSICGMPLKYVSLVTLAVQNALLTLIMHYSRVSADASHTYSAAAAVLLVELLKGSISLLVAFVRVDSYSPQYIPNAPSSLSAKSTWTPRALFCRCRRLGKEVFRPDCWKLSIPAILYVIQNNLQFVAVSNLEAATFQVSYQMKILTTAAFSVLLLRRKLTPVKWLALLFLAIGVGIVQIQTGSHKASQTTAHDMNAFKGFMAVLAACFTSGLAGVYFEMVLKNSQADLWVRNVQLSLFSLLPALVPIIFTNSSASPSGWFSTSLFENFGAWAWATVLIQVLGGLLTALVIKYADNILKGFATSLSIVISFLASVALFHFQMTVTFVLGSTVVLIATWLYNQPDASSSVEGSCRTWAWRWRRPTLSSAQSVSSFELAGSNLSRRASSSSLSSLMSHPAATTPSKSYPGSPLAEAPLLGQLLEKNMLAKKKEHGHGHGHEHLFQFAPLRATTKALASRVAQQLAPSGGPPSEHGYAQLYVSSSQSVLPSSSSSSYPPSSSVSSSRPTSALGSYPSSRPSSAMGGPPSLGDAAERGS